MQLLLKPETLKVEKHKKFEMDHWKLDQEIEVCTPFLNDNGITQQCRTWTKNIIKIQLKTFRWGGNWTIYYNLYKNDHGVKNGFILHKKDWITKSSSISKEEEVNCNGCMWLNRTQLFHSKRKGCNRCWHWSGQKMSRRTLSSLGLSNSSCSIKIESKAPWAAHGWIAQSQVYFCLCSKTSLCAKLLVWKYMSPVHSFTWKSSHFHVKRLVQALVLKKQTATQKWK